MTARHATFAAVTAAAALAVAGCGQSKDKPGPGIPRATVAELDSRLTELDNRVAARVTGACDDARREDIPAIRSAVAGLPSDTDPAVRRALEDSVRRLEQLFNSECSAIARKDSQTDTTPTPTETVTPPPQTVQTVTAPPPATQTTPTPTTTTPAKKPKKNGKANGNGNGNGGSTPSFGGGAGQ